MTANQPPLIAAWLLRHFGSSPNNDVVIGDLNERYQRGRSRLWYWRQVAATIVVGFLNEVWSHKFLTIRVVALGWALDIVLRRAIDVTVGLLLALQSWSRLWRMDYINIATQFSELTLITLFTGWLISTRSRQSPKAMVLAYAAYFAGVRIVWLVLTLSQGTDLQSFVFVAVAMPVGLAAILIGGGVFNTQRQIS